jgi:DNA-binding PadR family transcriptional regulator
VDVDQFLPLTPVAFEILLAVAEDERHGYAIMQDIEEAPDLDDARRRYYAPTALGKRVAEAEARRLAAQVAAARAKKLLRRA